MLRYGLSLASLATVVAFTEAAFTVAAGGSSKLVHGTCKPYRGYIVKTFTMARYTTNDTELASNDTCTVQVPTFQCGGFCETYAQATAGLMNAYGVYELKFEESCKCCEAPKSEIREITVPPNTFKCQENPSVKWDKEIVYENVLFCACHTCRGTRTLAPP